MWFVISVILTLLLVVCFVKLKAAYKAVDYSAKRKTGKQPKTESSSICPYCGRVLEKKLTRSRKCPNCGQQIVVRDKKVMTERQAVEYDKAVIQKQKKELENFHRNQLIDYKKSGVTKYVEILAAGENSCPACKALDRKRFLLKNELQNPTLPVKNCTGCYGYCRCCYIPVVD
jgi:predicted RNA-binding Zn-ribbon protein involved in translation (DUF1610 family)